MCRPKCLNFNITCVQNTRQTLMYHCFISRSNWKVVSMKLKFLSAHGKRRKDEFIFSLSLGLLNCVWYTCSQLFQYKYIRLIRCWTSRLHIQTIRGNIQSPSSWLKMDFRRKQVPPKIKRPHGVYITTVKYEGNIVMAGKDAFIRQGSLFSHIPVTKALKNIQPP